MPTLLAPPPRRTSARARLVALLGYAGLLLIWIRVLGIPNDTVQVFLWLWLGTIAWNIGAPARSHLAFLRDWSLPVAGLILYFYSRGLTDELGLAVHVQMPITVDEWVGGGVTPTERLQAAWCGDPCLTSSEPRVHDAFFTTVYATHFLAGLTLAAVLWVRDRGEWVKWMRRYLAISFGALAVYILYPMAPPWMASDLDRMGQVSRITSRGWADIGLDRVDLILQGSATRSPRCRPSTRECRSSSPCTPSSDCAPRGAGRWSPTPSRCRRRWSTSRSTTSSTSWRGSCWPSSCWSGPRPTRDAVRAQPRRPGRAKVYSTRTGWGGKLVLDSCPVGSQPSFS